MPATTRTPIVAGKNQRGRSRRRRGVGGGSGTPESAGAAVAVLVIEEAESIEEAVSFCGSATDHRLPGRAATVSRSRRVRALLGRLDLGGAGGGRDLVVVLLDVDVPDVVGRPVDHALHGQLRREHRVVLVVVAEHAVAPDRVQ